MRMGLACTAVLLVACGQGVEDNQASPEASSTASDEQARAARCQGDGGRLDLADVSFLMPLPSRLDGGELLTLTSSGSKGALFPTSLQGFVESPIANDPVQTLDEVRILSARVDPCFMAKFGMPCRRQIRLVGQPLGKARDGGVTTGDASVHLFYDLSEAEFTRVLGEVRALKAQAGSKTDCAPLGVHPVMKMEGLSGKYYAALRSMILEHCGEQTLTRVAFMDLLTAGSEWDFGALNRDGGVLVQDPIALLGTRTTQELFFAPVTLDNGGIPMFPAPATGAQMLLLNDDLVRDAGVARLESGILADHRIENPTLSNVGTTDCADCHVSDRARNEALRLRGVTLDDAGTRYAAAGFNLENVTENRTLFNLHALGYLGTTPSVTQRTINESAAVAQKLNVVSP